MKVIINVTSTFEIHLQRTNLSIFLTKFLLRGVNRFNRVNAIFHLRKYFDSIANNEIYKDCSFDIRDKLCFKFFYISLYRCTLTKFKIIKNYNKIKKKNGKKREYKLPF